MRAAIIADTHFGDPNSRLAVAKTTEGQLRGETGPGLSQFQSALARFLERSAAEGEVPGKLDYLILLGDILDFSIASCGEAYVAARTFFQGIQPLTDKVIYLPGNHDHDVWATIEHEANVVNQLRSGAEPRQFKTSVPCVLDDRAAQGSEHGKAFLAGVRRKPGVDPYGGLFLDCITQTAVPDTPPGSPPRLTGTPLTFYVAYPNLYLISDSETVLLTHGQYLEQYWVFLAEWLPRIAPEMLQLKVSSDVSVCDLVGLNFPLNQLACSGVGQAAPIRAAALRVEKEVKRGDLRTVKSLLERLKSELDKELGGTRYSPLEWLTDLGLRAAKKWALSRLRPESPSLHGNPSWLTDRAFQDRLRTYFRATKVERSWLRNPAATPSAIDVPEPSALIFGHTHEPLSWNAPTGGIEIDGRLIMLRNCGSFLENEGPAEVFFYATGSGWSSVSV